MLRILILLASTLLLYSSISAQVFQSTAPPPPPPDPTAAPQITTPGVPLINLDTSFIHWSEEQLRLLNPKEQTFRQLGFPEQRFGHLHLSEDRQAVALVKYLYENGQNVGSELHLNLLDTTGMIMDSLVLLHDKGIGIVGLSGDETHFFVAYEKSISSGDRDTYVAKVDRKAQLLWEVNIGKRFGTYGLSLLKMAPDGTLVLFSQMYRQVGFDFISPDGQLTERKLLHFKQDFSPKSFFFKPNGHLIGIGTYTEYENSNTLTSSVIFELDATYRVLRHQQIRSPYNDVAQDVAMDEQGHYYFLTNAEDSKAPYGQRSNFITIGKLDQHFNLIASTNIQNTETGLSLGLAYHPQQGIWAYQRFWNKGLSFALFQLDTELELQAILSAEGRFGTPQQMALEGNQLYFLFEGRESKVISFPLEK